MGGNSGSAPTSPTVPRSANRVGLAQRKGVRDTTSGRKKIYWSLSFFAYIIFFSVSTGSKKLTSHSKSLKDYIFRQDADVVTTW